MGQHREMCFTRFVQNGRVCMVNYGPDEGKLVMIVDVVDDKRCVVIGPKTGVARQMMGYKRLSLTDLVVGNVGRGCRNGTATKLWDAADVEAQFLSSGWGSTVAKRKAKTEANDFQRFQAAKLKQKVNQKARAALA